MKWLKNSTTTTDAGALALEEPHAEAQAPVWSQLAMRGYDVPRRTLEQALQPPPWAVSRFTTDKKPTRKYALLVSQWRIQDILLPRLTCRCGCIGDCSRCLACVVSRADGVAWSPQRAVQ